MANCCYTARVKTESPIAIMIHDLNPWAGQDRSALEIAWQLNQEFPIEIHAFSIEGYNDWPAMKHIKYQTKFHKPVLFKYLNYHFNSWKRLKNRNNSFVQSTGTASMVSSIIQVHFVHHAWQRVTHRLPPSRFKSTSLLKNTYQSILDLYRCQLEKYLYQPEKKYIAISHLIKKELMEFFAIPEENIEVIYHGVDSQYFHPWTEDDSASKMRDQKRRQLGIEKEDFVLLHVGQLNARKGLYKSLKVLSFLKKNGFKNVKLLAVGDGQSEKIQQMAEELKISKQLILVPHSKDVREYYWAGDCLFFPTYYEPFGLAILEAMACGLPVVTSEAAGASELINESENGLLFDAWAKPSEIANCILPLLRDPTFAKQLSWRGRQTAERQTWQLAGEKYRQFYKKLYQNKS